MLPSRPESVGLSVGLLGVILSVNRFVRLLSNTWAGQICDRYGRRWPFLPALIVGAAITVGYGLIWGFPAFLLMRLLWGLCWSFLRLEYYQTVYDTAHRGNMARLMGTAHSITRMGSLAGMLFGGLLTDLLGFAPTLFLFGGLSLTAVPLALRWPAPKRPATSPPDEMVSADEGAAPPPEPSTAEPTPSARVMRARRGAVCWLGFCVLFAGAAIVDSTLGRLLLVRLGRTVPLLGVSLGVASLTGILLGVWLAIGLVTAPLFGHAADRLGRGRLILSAIFAAVLGLLALGCALHLATIMLGVVVLAFARAAVAPALDATAGSLTTLRDRARFVSRYVTFMDLGSACGPFLGLPLAAALGLGATYLLGAALLVSAAAAYLLTFRRSQ